MSTYVVLVIISPLSLFFRPTATEQKTLKSPETTLTTFRMQLRQSMNRSMLHSSVEVAAAAAVIADPETMGIVPRMEVNVMVGSEEV